MQVVRRKAHWRPGRDSDRERTIRTPATRQCCVFQGNADVIRQGVYAKRLVHYGLEIFHALEVCICGHAILTYCRYDFCSQLGVYVRVSSELEQSPYENCCCRVAAGKEQGDDLITKEGSRSREGG